MMSPILLKKQEEQNSKLLRDLLRLPENKKCFDCPTKSPFFVNTTLHTFICTRCSGLVREVGHRVKSISASTFTGPELAALELCGNGVAKGIWLSCGYNTTDTPEPESDGEVRAFMRQKYYERKWLNRELAASHDQALKQRINDLFTEEGLPRQQTRRRRATIENNTTNGITIPLNTKDGHCLRNLPKPLDLSSTHKVQQPTIQTAPLAKTSYQPQPNFSSSKAVPVSALLSSTPDLHSNANIKKSTTPTESLFADLSGLSLLCPSRTQSASLVPSASGRPGSLITPTSSRDILKVNDGYSSGPLVDKTTNNPNHHASNSDQPGFLKSPDPYSALRTHHKQEQLRHEEMRSAISAITQSVTSTKRPEENKRYDPPTDPYAALRQMSYGSVHSSFGPSSHAIPQISQQTSDIIRQPQVSNHIPIDQYDHPSKMTREWVNTQHFVDANDDEDLMAQLSITSSQSTCSSKCNQISKTTKDTAFEDLDPLANYKKTKNITAMYPSIQQ